MNLSNYLQQAENEEIKFWINHNLKNYLSEKQEIISEIEHIIDYLNSDESPKRLRKMSYEQANEGAKKWVERMIKKSQDIVETEDDTEIVLNFDNGLRLVKLIGQNAFKREGNLMSHCVGSYHGKSDIDIYSLRDVNNNPHATMELQKTGGVVNQIKGKGNGSIHPKYINAIIKSLEYFGMDVRGSELTNIGYNELSEEYWKLLDNGFMGVKFITFKGKRYFYKNSKIKKR